MRATEVHDLLLICKTVIEDLPVWKPGEGQFSHIEYCRYCHYSRSHGHGENCIVVRLERATQAE